MTRKIVTGALVLVLQYLVSFFSIAQTSEPNTLVPVNLQLEAYNEGDIDKFLSAYSDTVKVYMYPNELRYQGLEKMRQTYAGMFERLPELNCEIVNRIVMGNVVIDHERVTTDKTKPPFEAIAIYKVHGGKISEVTFLQGKN